MLPYGGNWPSLGKKVTLRVGNSIFLHAYDQKDMYNPYALRAATDLIMHEIRVVSQGYGIPPHDAHNLRCMDGIKTVITPPKWLIKKKELVKEWDRRKKRRSVVDSFEAWLTSVPKPKITKSGTLTDQEKPPPLTHDRGDVSQEFLNWLNDQI
ncbi:MAG: hypothetical protein ACFE9L_13285 [Candidatus Hodarchaeota archaeon]